MTYTQQCSSCEHIFEHIRPLAEMDPNPPCEKCEAPTERILLPSGMDITSDPVVVYRTAGGEFRFPGDTDGASSKRYERLGYERVELRGWAQVRKFEQRFNTTQASEIARRVERHLESREAGVKMRRSEILNGMRNGFSIPEVDENGRRTGRMKTVHLSEAGRDIMQSVCDRNDHKPRPRSYDPGFFVDVFSNNRGSRDESRRSDGKHFRD